MKFIHHIIDRMILFITGRALVVLSAKDSRIKKELEYWPKEFTAALAADRHGPFMVVKKINDKLHYLGFKEDEKIANIKLYFKDEELAYQVFSVKESIRDSFSEHRLIIDGDFSVGVSLIYMLEILESYLLPSFITKNILPGKTKKETGRVMLFLHALTLNKEKGECNEVS